MGLKQVSYAFGQVIRSARKEQEYSQRELAKLIGVNHTYLSKLENDHAGYPPSEEVIQALAEKLYLKPDELRTLAGRITPEDEKVFQELVKQYNQVPALLRRMRDNPEYAKKLLSDVEDEEKKL